MDWPNACLGANACAARLSERRLILVRPQLEVGRAVPLLRRVERLTAQLELVHVAAVVVRVLVRTDVFILYLDTCRTTC